MVDRAGKVPAKEYALLLEQYVNNRGVLTEESMQVHPQAKYDVLLEDDGEDGAGGGEQCFLGCDLAGKDYEGSRLKDGKCFWLYPAKPSMVEVVAEGSGYKVRGLMIARETEFVLCTLWSHIV